VRLVHFEIAGDVQGVGFRAFARSTAVRLGLAGWVRNLSSGNLECTVAGATEAIDEFLAAMRHGPEAAGVKQLIVLTPPANPELPSPFTILK
jgi:acylphosphatase